MTNYQYKNYRFPVHYEIVFESLKAIKNLCI